MKKSGKTWRRRAAGGSACVQARRSRRGFEKAHHTKFNETVELAINLGVDPKHSDQVVRGTVGLPTARQSSSRLVIAGGDKVREAQEAARISSAATRSCRKSWKGGRTTTP